MIHTELINYNHRVQTLKIKMKVFNWVILKFSKNRRFFYFPGNSCLSSGGMKPNVISHRIVTNIANVTKTRMGRDPSNFSNDISRLL